MRTPHAIVALLFGLGSVAVAGASTPADASSRDSVLDAVRAFADGDDADGIRTMRSAAGLPSKSTRAAARPRVAPLAPVDVRFHFEATTEIQGFQIEVTYPLAKGEIVGSADGAQCSSDGTGFFVVNDRDDGTMTLIQANALPLAFPFDITCRFEQAPGQILAAADIGVTITEVTENGAVGDPAHLQVDIAVATAPPSLCEATEVTFTTASGAAIDAGWTGVYHHHALPTDVPLVLPVACAGGACGVDGTTLPEHVASPPIPLSAGGVSMCVLNTFRDAPSGTIDCSTGCSELTLPVLSRVFLVQEASNPCPPCVGDTTPNDGRKDGTCDGGTMPGAPCDVGGDSARFGAGGGLTSSDCVPTGSSVGELAVDLNPLTTGTVAVEANVPCLSGAFPDTPCFCPNQVAPNSCLDGTCPASGVCERGPVDGVCSAEPFRNCEPGSGTRDCGDIFPDAGSCIDEPRPCFGTSIVRTGSCGNGADESLVSVFCVAQTRSAAINTTMGLPGPAAVTLPVRVSPAPEPVESDGCDPTPRAGCRTAAATSVLLLQSGRAPEIAWRWLGGEATPPSAFGNPTIDTDYAFCAYSGSDLALAARAEAAAWHPTNKGGYVYRDPDGTAAGLTRIDLTSGTDGKSRVVVRGKGANLPVPPLPLGGPHIIQLQASNDSCWETTFTSSDVLKNDSKRLRAVQRR